MPDPTKKFTERPSLTHEKLVRLSDLEQVELYHRLDYNDLKVEHTRPRVRVARDGNDVVIDAHGALYLERYDTEQDAKTRMYAMTHSGVLDKLAEPSPDELIEDLFRQMARLMDMPMDMLCDVPTDSGAAVFYLDAVEAALNSPGLQRGDFSEVVDFEGLRIWKEEGGEFFAALPGDGPQDPSLGPFGCEADAAQGARRELLSRKYAAEAAQ